MSKKTRELIAVCSGLVTLFSGIALCYFSFFRNGHVGDGELWYFGQALVYAASIFGVAMYVRDNVKEMKNEILNELHESKKGGEMADEKV